MDDLEGSGGRELKYRDGGIPAIRPFVVGHLITASDLNELVDAIKELDDRLKVLERTCVTKA